MGGKRDLVRLLPNERLDLPDFDASQRNQRSAIRSSFLSLLFGDRTTAADIKRVFDGFVVAAQGTPDATISIGNGAASGGENLPDTDIEYGVLFGREVQGTQTLDFTGQPNDTYGIYVRYSATPGQLGTRVFWNASTTQEDVDALETRYVVDWDVQYNTVSPGDEWVKIADVVWGGTSVAGGDISDARFLFFEGDADNSFAHDWGDGPNDRDTDRGQYGVTDLWTWVAAVRRQIAEIIGDDWFTVPTVALNTHTTDTTDPHGSVLTQTQLDVTTLNVAGVLTSTNATVNWTNYPVRRVTVPAATFIAALNTSGAGEIAHPVGGSANGTVINRGAAGAFMYLDLGIYIPDGARIKSYTVYYNMTRTGNNLIVDLMEWSTVPTSSAASGWTFDYSSDDGVSTADTSFVVNNASTPKILDLETGAYLRITMQPTDATTDLEFHAIKIEWDTNSLYPAGFGY